MKKSNTENKTKYKQELAIYFILRQTHIQNEKQISHKQYFASQITFKTLFVNACNSQPCRFQNTFPLLADEITSFSQPETATTPPLEYSVAFE